MGGAVEEGGRRTRSSARGTAAATTPVTPAPKKPRVSRGRAKPKKIDVDDGEGEEEEVTNLVDFLKETETNKKSSSAGRTRIRTNRK